MLRNNQSFPCNWLQMAFWDLKMSAIWFSNVIGVLILFFMMLKHEKGLSSPMFSTTCWQSKSDYSVRGWKNRNRIGLEPKAQIVRHLRFVLMVRREGMEEYVERSVESKHCLHFLTPKWKYKIWNSSYNNGNNQLKNHSCLRKSKYYFSRSVIKR